MQKSKPGTAPWRTQGGCAVDAWTCGVHLPCRLVGIVILSRRRSAERSGGEHGRVAARRSQVRPTLTSRAQCPSCYPNSYRCPFRTLRTHPAGAAASSPGRTGAVRERTCGSRATRGHGCCVVCAGGLVVCKRLVNAVLFSDAAATKRGHGCPFCEKSLLGCSCMTFFFILLCLLRGLC